MALFIALIFLLFYVYLFYPFLLYVVAWVKVSGTRLKAEEKVGSYLSVSMIVSAYNEEEHIKEKIENFLSLDYPTEKIWLLIGSDGSTDGTANLVKSFASERIRLFEYGTRRGKTAVLNDVAKIAKGEIIIFSDADTMYDMNAIKSLVSHFNDKAVGGVCGRLLLDGADGSLASEGLYWRYENYIKEKESEIKTMVGINGQIFAIRRELFEPLPENVITEDQVLGIKILGRGYNILFDKEAIAKERIGTPREEFNRRVRISAGNFQSIAFSSKILNPKTGFASFALWSHKILRWFAPFFLIAIFITNLFLLKILFFKFVFFGQIIFYLTFVIYYGLTILKIKERITEAIYYFITMNLAVLLGFYRFLTNSQKVTWKK